ncbi:MAG: di-/tricarboxylate transporter [Bacillota bacterium]|nr:MAG: di-/tricarboxylate transporter [Bacillota bacterium]MBS3950401.1 anion permease [Peptococcaceae bacterium]
MKVTLEQARSQPKSLAQYFRLTMAVLGVLAGSGLALTTPPVGLTPKAMQALGLLVWAIFYWVGHVWDDYVVALAMAVGWIMLGLVPFETAFATFHSKTWWLMLGALGLGAGVARSGLLRRSTLLMLKLLPPTYVGQTLALFATGAIFCPAIPSVIAKVSIAGKFIPELGKGMGFEERSRESAGLFLAMYLGFVLAAPMYLTATSTNMTLVELLPKAEVARMTWGYWLLAAAPTTLLAAVLGYVALLVMFKPKKAVVADRGSVERELAALGPVTQPEKITLWVLVTAVVLWITESVHGQVPATVALLGLTVLLMTGVVDKKTFHNDVGWSSLVFIAVILNLGTVFPALGIDKYLGTQVLPVLGPLAQNIWVFVPLLLLLTFALRFVIVSMNALLAILLLVLLPVAQSVGMTGWALGMIIHFASHCLWILPYQNVVYAIGVEAAEGKGISSGDSARYSLVFSALTFVAVLASIPYWRMLGLL